MQDINRVEIEGNLVRDAKVFPTANGKKIVSNTIAHNRSFKKGAEYVKETSFIDLTAFGSAAEQLEQFKKGDKVKIEGEIRQENWNDKTTGEKRSKLSITMWKIEPVQIPARRESTASPAKPPKDQGDGFKDDTFDEESPPF